MRIAKVEDGMEARVVVDGGEQTERDGNNQKIEKNREAEGQLGAIANCESEKCSRQERSEFNENKIERGYLTEHGKAEGQLPGPAKTEIAPAPRSKDRDQRKNNPFRQRLGPDHRQTKQKPNAQGCD